MWSGKSTVDVIVCPRDSATSASDGATSASEDVVPTLRLCQLTSWPSYAGYGFDVVTDKRRPRQTGTSPPPGTGRDQGDRCGHFIGKVAGGSPADCAGLLEGDRILEVNHASVERCEYDELTARIMAVKGELSVLVIDRATEKLCIDRRTSFTDPGHRVKHIMCPHLPPSQDEDESESASDEQREPDVKSRNSDASKSNHLRLCQLKRWPQFDGYGFNLHISQVDAGQFVVGHVEIQSPAAAAGLQNGDHLLQVNGQDVTTDGYEGVVAKIKAMPNEAHLLVADAETYEQFKRSDQHPASGTTEIFIEVIACPDEPVETRQTLAGEEHEALNGKDRYEDLQLAASAKEAKRRLQKKPDVKNANMSLRDKHEIFETL